MKRVLPLLILSASVSTSVFSKDMCHFVFRKNVQNVYSVDMEKIERINRLESWSGNLRALAYKENPLAPSAARKSLARFDRVEERLLVGESIEAVSAYRALFRRVEGSALIIERYTVLSDAMRKAKEAGARNYQDFFREEGVLKGLAESFSSKINNQDDLIKELKSVEETIRKRYRKLGKDFDEYNYARLNLEKLNNAEYCSPVCKEAIKEFQNSAGLSSPTDRALFKDLLGNRDGYSLREVREVFNSHPEAVLAARKKEFLQEGFVLVKKYANDLRLFRRLYAALAQSKWGRSSRLMKMFKSIYDQRYLEVDSVVAKRVAHSGGDTAKKFELMEAQTAQMDRDLFWVNLSRSVEGQLQKTWDELLAHAKATSSRFYERMAKAQELGQKLGPVSQVKLKGVKRTVAAVVVGGLAWSYINFESESQHNSVPPDESDPNLPSLEDILNESNDAQRREGGAENEDDPEVLIDYLSAEDDELTETLGELRQIDRTLEAGAE